MICNIITKKHTNTNNSYFSTVHKFAQNKTSNLKPTTHSHYGSQSFCQQHLWSTSKIAIGPIAIGYDKKPSYRWGTARRGRASWNLV